MCKILSGLVVICAMALTSVTSVPAHADDRIDIQMRVEGKILKADEIYGKPFVQDRTPSAYISTPVKGIHSGDEFCVLVIKDKLRAEVWISCGGDKKLQEQATKLAGQRVVVECKGDYKLQPRTVEWELNRVKYKKEVVDSAPVLTVTKLEPAK